MVIGARICTEQEKIDVWIRKPCDREDRLH